MNNKDRDAVNFLLAKEELVTSQFHSTASEIMKYGADSERGKDELNMLIKNVKRVLESIESTYLK